MNAGLQLRIQELQHELAAAKVAQDNGLDMKMEADDGEPSQQQRNNELQQQIDDWSNYLTSVENSTGLAAADIADEVYTLREALSTEKGTCEARGRTISNYEARLRSKDEKIGKMQKTLDAAQSEVQRLKAKVFREGLK